MREGDRVLAALPLFHGFGLSTLVNAPLISGCRVILVPEFSAEAVAMTRLHVLPADISASFSGRLRGRESSPS